MTTFAKGLASGTIQAPAKTSWWPRHTRTMLRYLVLSGSRTPNAKLEIANSMQKCAHEWEAMVPKAAQHGLMVEHAKLEMELVDAGRLNRDEDITEIGKKLIANVGLLTAVMPIAIREFPEDLFRRLFMSHVGLFVGCVRLRKEGSVANSADMESNMLQLADFTAEWL